MGYSNERGKICNLLTRPLQVFRDLSPTIILNVFVCNVHSLGLSDTFPLKIIPSFFIERKQEKYIDLRVSVLLICNKDTIV
jgi:hypothetical protein